MSHMFKKLSPLLLLLSVCSLQTMEKKHSCKKFRGTKRCRNGQEKKHSLAGYLVKIVYDGDFERLKELLEQGIALDRKDKQGFTLMHHAVIAGDVSIVSWLAHTVGVDVNTRDNAGRRCIDLAAQLNNFEMVQWLIDNRLVNINECNDNRRNLMHYAALGGSVIILQLLQDLGMKLRVRDDKGTDRFILPL